MRIITTSRVQIQNYQMKQSENNNFHLKTSPSVLKTVNKGGYKIRSVSLPNNKSIPLHRQYQFVKSSEPIKTKEVFPRMWGCINYEQQEKSHKYRVGIPNRSKTQQKIAPSLHKISTKEKQKSQVLLQNYLKRKSKSRINKQISSDLYEKLVLHQGPNKKMANSVIEHTSQNSPDHQGSNRYDKLSKSEQADRKIRHLSELIKWRGSIVQKIQSSLESIKHTYVNSF